MFQVVIDAVDEAVRHSAWAPVTIIDRLQRLLARDTSGRVRLLISDRKRPPIGFDEAIDTAVIDIDNTFTRDNVRAFIRVKVRRSLERSSMWPGAGNDIENKIVKISGANFLHATLAWRQFSQSIRYLSRDQIRASLSRLDIVSHGVAEVYCRLLETIST